MEPVEGRRFILLISVDRDHPTVIRRAGVEPIKFQGLRHTCATLLLAAGEPVHVVAARLGHRSTKMTFDVYSHSSQEMQQQAAATLSRTLHG